METLSKSELQELEKQLSCPSGDMGLEVGRRMHDSNINMTLNTLSEMQLAAGMKILEIGHGNSQHAHMALKEASNLHYCGLEISVTMHNEAIKINKELIGKGKASFHLYQGDKIPFKTNSFDRVFTVNTIYFWRNPTALLQEIERVLKPGGQCLITYAQKDFMKKLPFVGHQFWLYDNEEVRKLVEGTDMNISKIINITEDTPAGGNRRYSIAKLIKS
ncbi:class I SAM-dependent methyltransferase [Fulvivirga ligni]|uniref:class I SAM-dependent methyltransferase n=1 Tax=Fulvivirga ligni TaxID=2904246 RepID=UPI001F47DEA5|nr:class I SAM-dependent methyltransferase [Fulvivirga ligni]UII21713.1 class I SAM-dependent methyltransferase [Fulvivirga ligni]